jgi:hypothetical protein
MNGENYADTDIVELAVLRELAGRVRQRQPWLAEICRIIEEEAALLDRRGVSHAPRMDLATDIGLLVLEMLEEDAVNTTPDELGVLKKLT